MSGQIILFAVAGPLGGKPPALKGPIWMEPAVEPEDAKRFLKMIAGSAAEKKDMEGLVMRAPAQMGSAASKALPVLHETP